MTEKKTSPEKPISLEGKYCLSFAFLKYGLPLHIIAILSLAYGKDVFGDRYHDLLHIIFFGVAMLLGGLFLAPSLRIWERVPEKTPLAPKGRHCG